MGQKRNSKIILVIIIVLISLILITGVAYAYFATDVFKSNQELFFKYITQIGEEKEGFIDTQLKQYFEKQKTTPYQNQGTFIPNITTEGGEVAEYEAINNFNISFSGQIDTTNRNFTQDVSLNYSEDVTFPVSCRKVGNTIGWQTEYVGSKYISVETDKLEEDSESSLYDMVEETQKLKNLTNQPFTKEDLKQLQETYLGIINNGLQENQFSKIQENKENGYKLTINGEQFRNILVQILENLKNDQKTLDKINEYLKEQQSSTKITANTIDNYSKALKQNTEGNDENYEITVFQQKGKTTKLMISNQEFGIIIEKKKEGDSLQYKILLTNYTEDAGNVELSVSANFTGLKGLQNVKEEYAVEIVMQPSQNILQKTQEEQSNTSLMEEKELIKLLISDVNVKNIANNSDTIITKEKLEEIQQEDELGNYENIDFEQKEDNKIIITFTDSKDKFEISEKGKIMKEPETTINEANNTLNKIIASYQFNNQIDFIEKMEIEEFSNTNAIILNNYDEEQVNNFLQQVEERIQKVNEQQMEELGLEESENPIMQMFAPLLGMTIYNQANSAIQMNTTNMSETEINAFNEKFENYESTNLQGVTVKGLLSTIQLNNEAQDSEDRKIKEIHFDGEEYEVTDQNIILLKSTVETETAYRVEFERDENTGIIYRAVINKK